MLNEEKTNDYENFEKGMIYMNILKKGEVVEKRREEETKYMPHAPVLTRLLEGSENGRVVTVAMLL